MGKRTDWNKKVNEILKKRYEKLGIRWCEIGLGGCCHQYYLTWCHRKNRRHYNSIEELTDQKEVVLACMNCHQKVEHDKELRESVFKRLRGI